MFILQLKNNLDSKMYKKMQFFVKWIYNIYLTKAKSRTFPLFTKIIKI